MCSPASVTLASIVTILVSFEASLIYLPYLKIDLFTEFFFKIASKLSSSLTILDSITLKG